MVVRRRAAASRPEQGLRVSKEHQIAIALQDRLLEWGRQSAAAAIATIYRPSSDVMRVGGDWFTVTSLDSQGRIGVSVGDVGGHGLGAATVMSELRSALAVASLAVRDPSDILDLLERYARQIPGANCTTVACAVLDQSCYRIDYACAGHPYPVIVGPDGRARMLEEGRRPPLAAASTVGPASQGGSSLPPGSLLILYTDGLVERRGESLEVGFNRLLDAAASAGRKPVSEVCSDLVAQLQPPSGYEDDVVVVALRPCGESETSFVEVIPAEVSAAPPLRARFRTWLKHRNLDEETV